VSLTLLPTDREVEADDLLRRRAARLAQPLPRQPATRGQVATELAIAEFRLGDERYAFPLAELLAALPLKHVTAVPLAPAHVIGVLRYQGKVLAAMSLAALLGIRGWRTDPAVLLLLTCNRRMLAVDCETIPKRASLSLAAVESARGREPGPIVEVPFGDGDGVRLVDLDRLLSARGGR
jgi:chemotaxis signal transduction protein